MRQLDPRVLGAPEKADDVEIHERDLVEVQHDRGTAARDLIFEVRQVLALHSTNQA
jgi:hypothetical protein